MKLGQPDASGRPTPQLIPGSEFVLPADQVVKAIGQEKPSLARRLGIAMENRKIKVNTEFETNLTGLFAGGDSIRSRGACSTVMAVQDGKLAATAIHHKLMKSESPPHASRSEPDGRY